MFYVGNDSSYLPSVNTSSNRELEPKLNIASATRVVICTIGDFLAFKDQGEFAMSSKKIKTDVFSSSLYFHDSRVKNLSNLKDFLSSNSGLTSLNLAVSTENSLEDKSSTDFGLLSEFFPKISFLELECYSPDPEWFSSLTKLKTLLLTDCAVDVFSTENFPKISKLSLRNYTAPLSYEVLRSLPLRLLEVDASAQVDLHQLTNLVDLDTMFITDVEHAQIPCFEGCSNLRAVSISKLRSLGIQPLHTLPSLQHFQLQDVRDDISLYFLQNCRSLKIVLLSKVTVTDLTPLATCVSLEKIFITDTHNLRDISPIMTLPSIREITIFSAELDTSNISIFPSTLTCVRLSGKTMGGNFRFNSQMEEITFEFKTYKGKLSFLNTKLLRKSLTTLNLADYTLEDAEEKHIAKLVNLQTVSLMEITKANIGLFTNLTKLEQISIWGINVSDLDELKNCTNVKSLFIFDGQHLSDIKAIKSFPFLNSVCCQNCPALTSVEYLAECPFLSEVSFVKCGITSFIPFKMWPYLQKIQINSRSLTKDELLTYSEKQERKGKGRRKK